MKEVVLNHSKKNIFKFFDQFWFLLLDEIWLEYKLKRNDYSLNMNFIQEIEKPVRKYK
jgi:hypothetical protein